MVVRSRISILVITVIAFATGGALSAYAQGASEFAPLPAQPSKPHPKRAAPPKPPAPPQAEATPAPAPAEAATPAPVEPAPTPTVSNPPAPAAPPVAVEKPKAPEAESAKAAEKPEAKPTPALSAAEKKMQQKEKAKEEKEAREKETEKKKKAAELREKEKAEKEANAPLPKPQKVELKNAAKLPPDDKGQRALEFIGGCADHYDKCVAFVNAQAEKIPEGDVCLQNAADQQEVTEKVRKFITLRPAIQGEAANRMVTEALYVIYPCHRAAGRTAGKKK